jgi:cation transport protein ChaC
VPFPLAFDTMPHRVDQRPIPPGCHSDSAMLLPPEAFRHVPALAGRILEPEKSFFRLSRERLAELDRAAEANGYSPGWRLTDEAREVTRRDLLAGHSGDLWIFAYGSLMWDPGIHVVEIRTAMLLGFHRRFCLQSRIGRGSAENPALMAALDHGGACSGLALRVPAGHVERETEILWMREMLTGSYLPTVVAIDTPQGSIRAVAFLINHQSDRYVRLDTAETARLIATGRGVRGTCLEYLENLVERLDLLELSDPDLSELRRQVHALLAADSGHTAGDSGVAAQ